MLVEPRNIYGLDDFFFVLLVLWWCALAGASEKNALRVYSAFQKFSTFLVRTDKDDVQ
jgi:hypothetical protein